jgi:hypothetical protein
MDLLHKLDEPDRWWFAPLIWAGAYTAIAVFVWLISLTLLFSQETAITLDRLVAIPSKT